MKELDTAALGLRLRRRREDQPPQSLGMPYFREER